MLQFSAHLNFLYQDIPFLKRIGAAADAGFKAVECMYPQDTPANVLRAEVDRRGMALALVNAPSGDWAGGERGIAVLPGRDGEFADSIREACRFAGVAGCGRVNVLAGIAGADEPREAVEARLVERLRAAADVFAPHGIDLLLEPINAKDFGGYFVDRPSAGLWILDRVARDNVKLLYDVYHAQRTEGELTDFLRAHLDRIGHIQIADVPGRHEPGTGEINYPFLFDELERLGYAGWIGLEYRPSADTESSLGWLHAMGMVRLA